GFEIASGSIRNQSPETMVAAFEKVGLNQHDVEDRFGGLYRAFQYGSPPHGGAAFGIDRIIMLVHREKRDFAQVLRADEQH
ncbi:amino acid--tRNA ligase-related protein, partial [Rhizobium ruizarguesonis]